MERIITDDLIFRPYQMSDFADVHEYGSDPHVVQYMSFGPNTVEDTRAFINGTIEAWAKEPPPRYEYAIELRRGEAAGRVVGGCGMHITSYWSAEIGYCLNRKFWGMGIGTKAAGFMIGQAFERLNVHRVIAHCAIDNIGSWRVMEKNGMRREGLIRGLLKRDDKWLDSYLYAILIDEWEARVAEIRTEAK